MSAGFRATHLPGLEADQISWKPLSKNGSLADIEVPSLSSKQILKVAQTVRTASELYLRSMPVSDIIERIDAAIHCLLDPQHPARQQLDHWLPKICELDADMVRLGLNRYLQTFRAPQLHRFVAEDLPNPKILDEFQPLVKGGWARALGARQLVHYWAGNVPGLPLWSMVCGLLTKSANIGKVASAEPVFATVFAKTLAEIEPKWEQIFGVLWWEGGNIEPEQALFSEADIVLAYGGDAALQALQNRLPVNIRFLPHGHRISLGMISSSALTARHAPEVARQAALDVVRYDQSGCYSPHVFYVEKNGRVKPREWAERLFHEIQGLQHRFPQRTPSLTEAQTLAQWRQNNLWSSSDSCLLQNPQGTGGDVVYFEQMPALMPGPLQRCVQVVAVNQLLDVMPMLEAQRCWLQTAGLAVNQKEWRQLAQPLGMAGVTRLCAIGAMTSPEAGWHHDGRYSMRDFLKWVELEQSAELACERFNDYDD
jgi:hypothetical protein